jgi:hypothetical protein
MPRGPKPEPQEENLTAEDRQRERRQRQERMMAPLKIKTRDVPRELAAKWYGMPPTEAKAYAQPQRTDTISF